MVNAMVTGGSPGLTSLAGCLLCSLSFQVMIVVKKNNAPLNYLLHLFIFFTQKYKKNHII